MSLRALLAPCTLLTVAVAQVPCWETNLGSNLSLGDDAQTLRSLNFSFPFGGSTYADVVICSNGYIWVGALSSVAPDYSPSEAELLAQLPRLAPLWCDFDPSAAGSGNVWFNTFPASGSNPARAVITWDNVFEYQRTVPLSFQVQILETGAVYFHYDSNTAVVAGGFGTANHVVGLSQGNGATANPVNFSALPIVAATATAHQTIARGAFPLVGKDLEFSPAGNGFVVTERPQCSPGTFVKFGSGCPRNLNSYELFATPQTFDLSNTSMHFVPAGGGYAKIPGPGIDPNYSNAIILGDDAETTFPLQFSFPFAGSVHTQVAVASNGVLWFGSLPSGNRTWGYATEAMVTSEPNPLIAPCWMDLDPSAGGTVYFDATANQAMVTWVNVPFWNQPGSANTLQVKFTSGGDFFLNFGTVRNDGPAVVGLSAAQNSFNPGSLDWSSLPFFTTGSIGNVPLTLDAAAGSRPAVGTTFNMVVGNIPTGVNLGAMVLSFSQQNLYLQQLGMPGCFQYLNLDATFLLLPTGPTVQWGFPVPTNQRYLNTHLFCQAVMFAPGSNALGAVSSNAGDAKVGL